MSDGDRDAEGPIRNAEGPIRNAEGRDPRLAAVLGALHVQARGLILECVDGFGRDRALTGNDLQRRIGGVVARLELHRISRSDCVELATTSAPAVVAAALAVLTVGAELRFGAPTDATWPAPRPAALRLLNDTGVEQAPDHRSVVLLSELPDVELGPLLGLDRPSASGRLHDGGDLFTLDRLFQLARELTDQFRIQPSSIVAFGFASTDAFLPISLSLGALMRRSSTPGVRQCVRPSPPTTVVSDAQEM